MSWSKSFGAILGLFLLSPLTLANENSQDKALDEIKKELAELRKQNVELRERIEGLGGAAQPGEQSSDLARELRELNTRLYQNAGGMNQQEKGHLGLDLKMTGSIRERLEYFDHTDSTSDFRMLQRLRLNMNIKVHDQVKIVTTLQDSRSWGDDAVVGGVVPEEGVTNATTTTIDSSPNFQQAYVWLGDFMGTGADVRFGRQIIEFADERVIGDFDWNNISRSFEGLRADGHSDDLSYTFMWATIQNNNFDGLANEDMLTGLYFEYPLDPDMFDLDFYAFHRDNDTVDLHALYLGVLFEGGMEFLDYDFEYTAIRTQPDNAGVTTKTDGQLEFTDAYRVHAGIGLTIPDVEGDPRIGFSYDMGSNHWIELFPTNHSRFGWSDVFVSHTNLVHTQVDLYLNVYESWDAGIEYHWNRAFRQAGSNDLGTELDIVLKGKCADVLDILIAAGRQFGGDGLATFGAAAPWRTVTAGNTTDDSTFAYVQFTVPF